MCALLFLRGSSGYFSLITSVSPGTGDVLAIIFINASPEKMSINGMLMLHNSK